MSVLRRMLLLRSIQGSTVCITNDDSTILLTPKTAHNGVYLENGNLSDDLQPTATNPADVEKLWKLSEKLVGQEFPY